jgi:flagellar protein FliS
MLYDGAIGFLERGLHGFSLEDPAEHNATVGNNILKAQAILAELNQSLDMSAGGEFAANLRGLYDYLDRRLLESNLRKEPEGIREVIRHLGIIRAAWREMLAQQGAPHAAEVPLAVAAA